MFEIDSKQVIFSNRVVCFYFYFFSFEFLFLCGCLCWHCLVLKVSYDFRCQALVPYKLVAFKKSIYFTILLGKINSTIKCNDKQFLTKMKVNHHFSY